MNILAGIGPWFIEELLSWILYLLFVTFLWLLLFPILVVFGTPLFLLRAALHPSTFGQFFKLQFRKLMDLWIDLSIRLIPI